MVGGLCLHDVRRIDNVIGCWTIQLDLESVSCLAWDMTGRWLAAGCGFFMRRDDALSRGGNVYLFEKQPHSLELRLHRVFQGHEGEIRFLEFVASGQRLISASADGTLRVWNVTDPTGAAMVTDPNPNVDWRPGIVSVQMTADQRRLIAGLDDGIVLGWELDAGESLREAFRVRAHDGTVNAVAIEPQGRFFASGGHDTHVRLWAWDAPDDAIEIAVHDAPVKSLHVYGDGQIVSFSDAGHCRIDPTDLGELDRAAQRAAGRNLDPQEWRRFLSDQPYRPTCRELPLPGGELTGSGLGLDLEAAYRATDDLRDLSPGPGDDNFVDIIGEDQGWSLRAPADWQILDITRSGCELRDGEGLLVRLWVMDSLPSGGPESLTDYARQLTGTDVMPIETEVEASGEEESSGTNVVRLQFASSAPSAEALGVVVGEQRTSRATVLAMAAPQESLDTSLPAAAALADTIRLPAVEVATLAPRQAPDESYRLNIPESWVLFDESEAGSVRHAYRTCTGRGMLLLEQAACRSRDLEELEDLLAVALPSLGSRLINLFEVEEQPGLFAGKAEPLDPAPGESAPLSVLVFSTPGEGDWRLVVLQCAADDFEFYSEFFFSIAMSVRWTG
jgi:hypothetical protein